MNAAPAVFALLAVAGPASTQQPDDAALRCEALVRAQRDGRLDVAAALAALGDTDDDVARTAAALLRHAWPELPPALLDALADRPAAARRLLHELAVAPRPSLSHWVVRWGNAGLGRTADDRCLALAARGTPPTAAEAEVLVRVLVDGGEADGFGAAAAVLPPAVADALLGRLHAALLRGAVDVDRAGPLLDRLSPTGLRALLGLVETLPAAVAAPLAARVHDRLPELLQQRVAHALDGAAPLLPCWLPWCAPLLDRPPRIARVQALLGSDDEATAEAAFGALLGARVVDEALLDFAATDAAGRPGLLRRLLDRAIDLVPAGRLLLWLQADVETSKLVVAALPRRTRLEPELEQHLLARLQEAGVAEGAFLRPAALALAQRGGAGAVHGLWPWLRASRDWPELLDAFARRREPFVPELLLHELASPQPSHPGVEHDLWLDGVALALVAAGDRRELHRLVARAPRSSPSFVRRCAHHARPLPAALALRLVDEALAASDGDLGVELLAWAATAAADPLVLARLHALWREPPAAGSDELQEVALRALVAGEPRTELVAALRAALRAGPVPPRLEPLAFELLGTMPAPLRPEDLELCAELVLLAPRTDPDREAERARRWPDGSAGFPLVAAVAQRLRTAEPAAAARAFAAATAAALADPGHTAIAPQRLLVLLRTLAAAPAVQHALGEALAPLLLARAAATGVGAGIAHVYAAGAAAAHGEPAAASQHAAAARDLLLALPGQRLHARVVLGERDPGAGVDPWARLAALPHLHAFRAAVAAGDHGAARRAAALVREFAGRDDRIPTEAALAAELR